MERLMTLGVVLSAVDMISKPLAKMGQSVGALADRFKSVNLSHLTKELTSLDTKIAKLERFKLKLNQRFSLLQSHIKSAKATLSQIDREIQKFDKKKLDLQKAFKKGKIGAESFAKSIADIEAKITHLNAKKLSIKKEIDTNTAALQKTQHEIARTISLIDRLDAKKVSLKNELLQAKNAAIALNEKLRSVGSTIAKVSTASAAFGSAIVSPLKSMVSAYQEIQQAQGDIASLGIDAEGIENITKAAKQMSNQFAGVSAPEFIKASYDIKSGIASLSAQGVAEFTKFAAMTAQATKSSVAEMTKLFALGYGIFKRGDEDDFQFGKRFASHIALAVKAFRTEGSDLVQGISNIGAVAKSFGVTLSEELSIIGNAKGAFNSAAEAGTAYRAFLSNVVDAQKKLGLTFVDTTGKLLPMVEILRRIKAKFGETIDANEMNLLKKAFGSDEAVKMITALINKTDDLKKAKESLAKASIEDVKEMALARNSGKEFALLQQRLSNLAATFGKFLAPAVSFVSDKLGKLAMWLDHVANSNSFVKYIFYAVATLGALATLLGVVGIALSAFVTGLSFVNGALGIKVAILKTAEFVTKSYAFATKSAAIAAKLFNLALRANPIGIVITAIVALVGAFVYLYRKFDWFKNGVDAIWSFIKKIFAASPIGIIIANWSTITRFFVTFLRRLKSGFHAAMRFVVSVFLSPINTIQNLWHKLLGWIGTKISWVANIAGKIKSFFGFGKEEKKLVIKPMVEKIKPIVSAAAMSSTVAATPITPTPDKSQLYHPQTTSRHTSSVQAPANYTININVSGANSDEVVAKIEAILPHLLERIEEERKERALHDTL